MTALAVGGIYFMTKIDDLMAASERADERGYDRLAAASGGTAAERIERVRHINDTYSVPHVTRATVLVNAFDRSGDGRVTADEWKLQAGSDSMDGTRLFATAQYMSADATGPASDVGPEELVTLMEAYSGGDPDFVSGLDGPSGGSQFADTAEPVEGDDARWVAANPVFATGDDVQDSSMRPVDAGVAALMGRRDENRDGAIDIAIEGGSNPDQYHRIDLDGDGRVVTGELHAHLRAADTLTDLKYGETDPHPNGWLEPQEIHRSSLDEL